ncbi:MAG TPA: hypothetical protein VLB74_03315, partial [Flavobacterium sp.]|uniref:hypothetical protein n=1 Tax=Flavobacterium sp. TaxID=239 RepID=UPI002C840098|nr:hypothetical protein [Flavobacterium sp.]
MSNAIAVDSAGNRYITGHYSLTADFDLSPAIATHTSSGSVDSIIAKYDANGNYLWARSAGGVLEETASSIVMNNNDEMIITGAFSLNTDFDLSNDSFNLTSINSSDMFLAKYKDCSPTPVVVTLSGNTLITTTSADSYQWIDCSNNNTPISGATNASFTPAVSGNYAAVININGCRSISA